MRDYFHPKVEDFQWLRNAFMLSLPEQGLTDISTQKVRLSF
jgi:hypothetical protein